MRVKIAVILAVCAALAVAGGTLFAQGKAAMVTGKHDLRATGNTGDYCKTCHVAHASSSTNLGLLWNHTLSTATYSVWNTQDMPDYKGGATTVLSSSGSSSLCLSCHDGTVGRNVLISNGNTADGAFEAGALGGNDNLGTDLRNDHPVGFVYNTSYTANTTGYAVPANVVTAGLRLFGTSATTGKVECGTCHDPHANVASFLRIANTGSALCTTCHL
jgi:predicted CXXCH cytochrome family protein